MASSLEVCSCSCSVAPWSACCGSVCAGSAAAWVFVCVCWLPCLCEYACECVCMGRLLTRRVLVRGVEKGKEEELEREREGGMLCEKGRPSWRTRGCYNFKFSTRWTLFSLFCSIINKHIDIYSNPQPLRWGFCISLGNTLSLEAFTNTRSGNVRSQLNTKVRGWESILIHPRGCGLSVIRVEKWWRVVMLYYFQHFYDGAIMLKDI